MLNSSNKILKAALILPFIMMLAVTMPYLYLMIFGQEVSLLVTGFDPQELFRGNYVSLTYPNEQGVDPLYSAGKYLTFTYNGKYYAAKARTDQKPDKGIYFKAEKIPRQFFAPKELAQELERKLWTNHKYVAVFQYEDGRGYIKEIRPVH